MKVKVFTTLTVSNIEDQINDWLNEKLEDGIEVCFACDPIQASHNGHVVTTIFYREKQA